MTKCRSVFVLLASVSLASACSGASADRDSSASIGPEAITAVVSRGADARPLKLNHHALTLLWGVTRDEEEACGGPEIAGGEVGGKAQLSHLGNTTVSVSAAWDIGNLLQGPARYTPVGPAGGPVAPVLGRSQYPYAFRYDPTTDSCQPAVVATGRVVLTGASGDRLFGDITGGETHRLDFLGIPGSGIETFAEVAVTGGTGRFTGATGSFVVHTIARLTPTLTFSLTLVEVLPGGTVGY